MHVHQYYRVLSGLSVGVAMSVKNKIQACGSREIDRPRNTRSISKMKDILKGESTLSR